MGEIADAFNLLQSTCVGGGAISGQLFETNFGGYNIAIAYCNGNDPANATPTGYTPPGVNGEPSVICAGNSDVPCVVNTNCDTSTLTVDSHETVTCGEWMAATYVGYGDTITLDATHTIGTTWTLGGFAQFDTSDLFSAALSAGIVATFAETTTNGDTEGSSGMCGDPSTSGSWTCGLDVKPQCIHMSGTCQDGVLGTVP